MDVALQSIVSSRAYNAYYNRNSPTYRSIYVPTNRVNGGEEYQIDID
jgi:hypothetical protein